MCDVTSLWIPYSGVVEVARAVTAVTRGKPIEYNRFKADIYVFIMHREENTADREVNVEKRQTYKWCFVPQCTNTTLKTPNKVFLNVVKDELVRKRWCQAARRKFPVKKTSTLYCCEDHFDVSILLT